MKDWHVPGMWISDPKRKWNRQKENNPPYDCNEVSIDKRFSPEQVWDDGGEDESCHEEAFQVVAVLEHDEGVRLQVRHVDRLPCLHHGRVFSAEKKGSTNIMFNHTEVTPSSPDHEPAHVWEEEAPVGIVRVGLGLAALVVEPTTDKPFSSETPLFAHADQH